MCPYGITACHPIGEYCGQGRGDINPTLQRTQIILVFVLDECATKVNKKIKRQQFKKFTRVQLYLFILGLND